MRGLIAATCIAAFVWVGTSGVQGQTSSSGGATDIRCYPPVDRDSRDYVIDASSGTAVGKRRYKLTDQVRVVVKNLNPFKYSYVLTVKEEVVAEPAIGDFLKLLVIPGFNPTSDAADLEDKTEKSQESTESALESKSNCDERELERIAGTFVAATKGADENLAAVAKEIKRVTEVVTGHQGELSRDTAVCETLVSNAAALVAAVNDSEPNFDGARASIDALSVSVARVVDYRRRFPKCRDKLLETLESTAANYQKIIIPKLREDLKKFEDAKAKLDQVATGIATTLRTKPFYLVRFAGDYDLPTNVSLTVKRQDVTKEGAPAEALVESRLNFGGRARFALGGGLAYTALDNLRFQRVQGFVRDSDGAVLPGQTELATVIGVEEQSSSRIVPLAVLHGRLYERAGIGFHLTAGVTAKSDDLGTDIEYLLGPSFSFAEERLFVTVGAYGGRQQALEGDLYVGVRVPEDLVEIPVRKDREWDFGIALTYRLP